MKAKVINNIHEYKKAIQIEKDLKAVSLIFEQFLKDVIPYTKYSIVADSFRTVSDNQMWAKMYIRDQEKIIDSKGTDE